MKRALPGAIIMIICTTIASYNSWPIEAVCLGWLGAGISAIIYDLSYTDTK